MQESRSPASIGVVTTRYVRIGPVAEAITGISTKAMNQKIDEGVWAQNREWKKGPDGRRYLDIHGYERWVERGCR